jgi:tape measure domain-containing protein
MADAQIRITADTSQAEKALGNLQNALGAVAGAFAAKSTIDYISGLQDMSNKIKVSIGDQNMFGDSLLAVANIARATGSNLGAVADLYSKISFNAERLGLSQAQVGAATQNFAEALRYSGASAQGAAASLYQYGQMLNSGKVGGDEFRTLLENMGPAIVLMAKNAGIPFKQFREQITAGSIDVKDFNTMLANSSDQIKAKLGDIPLTLNQSLENVKTSFALMVLKIDQSTGASMALGKVFESLADNIDIVVGVASGFFAAWAVGRIIAVAEAIYGIVVALRTMTAMTAMATGGLSLIVGAAAGVAAWKLTGDAMDKAKEKMADIKKLQDEANKELKDMKVTYDAISDKIKTDILPGLQDQLKLAGMTKDQREIESKVLPIISNLTKGMTDEQKQQVASKFDILRATISATVAQEKLTKLNEETKNTNNLIAAQGVEDIARRNVLVALEAKRVEYGDAFFNKNRQIIEQNIKAEQVQKMLTDRMDEYKAAQEAVRIGGIMDPKAAAIEADISARRLKYGSDYTSQLEAQDRLRKGALYDADQLNQIQKTFLDLTRQQTDLEIAKRSASQFTGTKEGLGVEQGRNQEALKVLRDKGLIDEQSYNDQLILMTKSTQDSIFSIQQNAVVARIELANQEMLQRQALNDAVLAMEQKVGETRLRQAGVTNQGIIDAVKAQQAQVQMIQQGGIVGAQGVLGAMDNIFSAMGAHNKAAFETHKKLAVAQALISTYQAAAAALAFPPGPPISFIYVAGAIAAGMAQIASINSQQYSGKAKGGGVAGGMSYIVGEKGPELFTPSTGGNITPNDKMSAGGAVNVNFTINAVDATGFDTLLINRKGVITQIISDAMLEKGQRGL